VRPSRGKARPHILIAMRAHKRHWLAVTASDTDDPLALPGSEGLRIGDLVVVVVWPRTVRAVPTLGRTVGVIRPRSDATALRVRRRVAALDGHAVALLPLRLAALDGHAVALLPLRLAATRGWTFSKRDELVGTLRLLDERDFTVAERELLAIRLRYGPPAGRPAHARPRTPGRRALIVGRASVTGARR